MTNEVIYILPERRPGRRLKAEVVRVNGDQADVQIYEAPSAPLCAIR
jgi:V/A-type H+-transporting ATPase subunit A